MKVWKLTQKLVNVVIVVGLANNILLLTGKFRTCIIVFWGVAFILLNFFPSYYNKKMLKKGLRVEADGCELLELFLATVFSGGIYQIVAAFQMFPERWITWLMNLVCFVIVEAVIYWNGIIRVYATSTQLGIKWRIVGIVCGWIPIAHLVVLFVIMRTCQKEVWFENSKMLIDEQRQTQQICKTQYPLLMVHGVFFRDFRYFNYWGRIPAELVKNGATVFYGNHQSAASVKECGQELARNIKAIVRDTGCEKVNVIAHSKGGLDMRYAISCCGCAPMVASLTTISTPHRGCLFADYLLTKIPEKTKELVAKNYNRALKKLGDQKPDFMEAVTDLTADACEKLNKEALDMDGVFYQSVGSKLNFGVSGRFPLNFSYQLVKHFDGPNDGLVSDTSFPWGCKNQFLTVKGNRGISHGDMIDLNRENIEEFDVREFYVNLVAELKKQGF